MKLPNGLEVVNIYLLTNTINGKIYYGQSWNPIHERMGKNGAGYKNSTHLYGSIQKYGVENFQYTLVAQCKTQEDADYVEAWLITHYNTLNPNIGYNIKQGGSVGRHLESTKRQISETQKAKYAALTQEEKNAHNATIDGWWLGKEREPMSEERKQQNSEYMKQKHATVQHPMQGKHHSEETRRKQSEANMGHEVSESTRKAIGEAHKMDPEREKAILKAVESGKSHRAICREFGTNSRGIKRILERNNISGS